MTAPRLLMDWKWPTLHQEFDSNAVEIGRHVPAHGSISLSVGFTIRVNAVWEDEFATKRWVFVSMGFLTHRAQQ